MSNNSFNYKIFKINTKNSYLTINVPKASSNMKHKNAIISNMKNIPINISYKTINTSSINSTKNKNKLIIPKLIRDSKLENKKNKLEKFESLKYLKSKYFGRNVNNRNYLDINNNNYYVNLFNSSTPKYSKIDINKKFNSKENRILINKVKYLNLTNIKNTFNQTFSSNKKKYLFNYTENNEALEKMINYRNKLLLEFMKYIDKFLFLYKKRHFLLLTKNINIIKEKKLLHKCIYKKKIYKIPCRNSISKFYTFNTSLQKMKIKVINKNKNITNLNISGIKGKNLIKKIINNQSKDVLDGEIRNIFIDSNFPFKNKNLNNKSNTIYTSYKGKKNKFNLDSYNDREIEIKFKNVDYLNKEINKSPNKINLRSNSFSYNIWKKNVNKKYMKLTMQRAINEYYVINKRYIDNENQNKNLASITEEDEKIFISNQDLSGINNEIKKI